jgi:hypothetical protein
LGGNLAIVRGGQMHVLGFGDGALRGVVCVDQGRIVI